MNSLSSMTICPQDYFNGPHRPPKAPVLPSRVFCAPAHNIQLPPNPHNGPDSQTACREREVHQGAGGPARQVERGLGAQAQEARQPAHLAHVARRSRVRDFRRHTFRGPLPHHLRLMMRPSRGMAGWQAGSGPGRALERANTCRQSEASRMLERGGALDTLLSTSLT